MHGLSICTPARYADILCDRLRCHMAPALNLEKIFPVNTSVNTIASDRDVWPVEPGRTNPWKSEVDGIMFYL